MSLRNVPGLRFDLALKYLADTDSANQTQKFLEIAHARPRVWRTPNIVRLIMHYQPETIETICLLKNLHAIRNMFIALFSSVVGFYRDAPQSTPTDRFTSMDEKVWNRRTQMYAGPNALPFVDFEKIPTEEQLEEVTQIAIGSLIALAKSKRPYYDQFPMDPCDESKGEIVGPHDRVRWFLEFEIADLRFECDRYRKTYRDMSDDDFMNWEIRCAEWLTKKSFYLMQLIADRRAGLPLPDHDKVLSVMALPTPWYTRNDGADGFVTGYQQPTDSFGDARDEMLKSLRNEYDDYQAQVQLKRKYLPERKTAKRSHDVM